MRPILGWARYRHADRGSVPVRRRHAPGRRHHRRVGAERRARDSPVAEVDPAAVRIALPAALAIAALVGLAVWQHRCESRLASPASAPAAEAALERRFLALPSAQRIRDEHRIFAGEPHMAGSPRDRALMERTRDRFASFGLEQVEVTTHEVLLPWPEEVGWRWSRRSPGAHRCARSLLQRTRTPPSRRKDRACPSTPTRHPAR